MMVTWYIPKELRLFIVDFINFSLYILWEQFITVQVTHKTPYKQVPLRAMLVLKMLNHNLLNTVTFWNLEANIGGINV